MMNDMAARGDMQQQYPAMDGGATRTAWPEADEGFGQAGLPVAGPGTGAATCAASAPAAASAPGGSRSAGSKSGAPKGPAEPSEADEYVGLEHAPAAYASPEELELALFGRLVDPGNEEVRLASGPDSSAQARRLTMSALESWGLGGHGDVAVQLVAELIANVVRHTGGRTFGLRLVRRQGLVRFEVRDPSRALPCLIMGDLDDEGGRGLQLVNALAQRWGADLLSHGKSVWFELRVRETV